MEKKEEIAANIQRIIDCGQKLKYNRSGIYEIKVDGVQVYIGKSVDMLNRIANHMWEIEHNVKTKKYRFLKVAKDAGRKISFDVVTYVDGDEVELSKAEAAAITANLPILNLQIPALDGSNSWHLNRKARDLTYQQFIDFLGNE